MTRPVEELVKRVGMESGADMALWRQALTHSSANSRPHYERLEFLGDAVLKLVVSDWLYERYPHLNEGPMSTVRGRVVSDEVLARTARTMELGPHLILGSAERKGGGRENVGILASSFEALLAAIYIGQGYEMAATFLERWLAPEFEASIKLGKAENFKALLQEHTQGRWKILPVYKVIGESGPIHDRTYDVEVSIDAVPHGTGRGKSKRQAEQAAAAQALSKLGLVPEEAKGT